MDVDRIIDRCVILAIPQDNTNDTRIFDYIFLFDNDENYSNSWVVF